MKNDKISQIISKKDLESYLLKASPEAVADIIKYIQTERPHLAESIAAILKKNAT